MNARWMSALSLLGALGLCGCSGEADDSGPAGGGGGGEEAAWTEALCELEDLSDLEGSFSSLGLRGVSEAIADRRYPTGRVFIDALSDAELQTFLFGANDLDGVLDYYEFAIHEGCHIWGFDYFTGSSYAYNIADDLIIQTPYLDNFDRSDILDRHVDPGADFYADTYLTGSSGAQGFNTLLDEYNAYTHSLAISYCTRDQLASGASTSARDGILTMMYYVETYLKIAREEHPEQYQEIIDDPAHVEVILTIWDRAEFWLEVTADEPGLGISDDVIETWTYDPDNYAEIEALR